MKRQSHLNSAYFRQILESVSSGIQVIKLNWAWLTYSNAGDIFEGF